MVVVETKTYAGRLTLNSYGEADDVLFLSASEEPLAETLSYSIAGKVVSVRYWITDVETDKESAQEQFLRNLMGDAECEFQSHYSEVTGYLWTDEEINIGGHDLLEELQSNVGSWLILEVDIHPKDGA